MDSLNICVIGVGGIGTHLVDNLCMFLNYDNIVKEKHVTLYLIDGDNIEEKNYARQTFDKTCSRFILNKAIVKQMELSKKYENIEIIPIGEYLSPENINEILTTNIDIIFMCPDNAGVRNLISRHCQNNLSDVILINGGNGLYTANSYTYIRKNKVDITPAPHELFSNIEDAEYENPGDKSNSCQTVVESEPQIIFVNLYAAMAMLATFYCIHTNQDIINNYCNIDILKNVCVSSQLQN